MNQQNHICYFSVANFRCHFDVIYQLELEFVILIKVSEKELEK
jgi:hypothetical protein